MSYFSLDHCIVYLFLIIIMVVGLWQSRTSTTLKAYALGGKNFSTFSLVATIVATWFGGGFLYYTLANVYTKGLAFIVSMMGPPINLLLTSLLAFRMHTFLKHVSVASALGELYGKSIRTITAICGIIAICTPFV